MDSPTITKKERDCLIAILENEQDNFPIKLTELSNLLKIKPPTALSLVRRMEKKGILELSRGMIKATDDGIRKYKNIMYAHRVIECALNESGETPSESCTEAANYDYIVSENLIVEMDRLLGNPKKCPHGKEIKR